jgi:predicted nucleotidyltransferase component of viral defense system
MTGKEIKNVTASVLAKLRNTSKSSGAPFQQVLQLYAIERFLYRVSKSKHAQSVILKGALLLKTIGIPNARPTVDIDMLRKGKADHASLVALIKDSEYKGTRVLMDARMDNVRLKIQIDFGVGDVMVPGPRMIEFPVLLAGDTVHLLAYPIESSIAEKLQAMVALGNANSRMKDFYDVWICSKHLDFNADSLLKAIDATFKNRETPIPTEGIDAFTATFVEEHRAQWNAFVRKIGEKELVDALDRVVEDIQSFAGPALRSLASGETLKRQWKIGRGWVAV